MKNILKLIAVLCLFQFALPVSAGNDGGGGVVTPGNDGGGGGLTLGREFQWLGTELLVTLKEESDLSIIDLDQFKLIVDQTVIRAGDKEDLYKINTIQYIGLIENKWSQSDRRQKLKYALTRYLTLLPNIHLSENSKNQIVEVTLRRLAQDNLAQDLYPYVLEVKDGVIQMTHAHFGKRLELNIADFNDRDAFYKILKKNFVSSDAIDAMDRILVRKLLEAEDER